MELSLLGVGLRGASEAGVPSLGQRPDPMTSPPPGSLRPPDPTEEDPDFLVTNSLSDRDPRLPAAGRRPSSTRVVSTSSRSLETIPSATKGRELRLSDRSKTGLGQVSSRPSDRVDTSSPPPPSRTPLLNELDSAALRLGRMVLARARDQREGSSLEALSRFFLDNWLAKNESSSSRADTLSIQLMCALQAARTKVLEVDKEDEADATAAVKRVGAVALECLDVLIEEFGEGNPVLRDIRTALLPLIFLRPVDRELADLQFLFSDRVNSLDGGTYFSAYMWRENLLERLERDRAEQLEAESFSGKERLEAQVRHLRKVVDESTAKLGESNASLVRTRIKMDRAHVDFQSRLGEVEHLLRRKEEELEARRSLFDAALKEQMDLTGKLEREILDMRLGIEQLLEEKGEFIDKKFEEGGSVVLIVETLLNRLRLEETERKRLQELNSDAIPSLVEILYDIAQGSASLTTRLEAFVNENSRLQKTEFLAQWAQCMTDEIRFLQELRMQRDELFEMKLKSLHKIYTQAQTEEEISVVERCSNLIESLQNELGSSHELLLSKDNLIQQKEHVIGKLTDTITGMENQIAGFEKQLAQYQSYLGRDSGDGPFKKPKDYENEIYFLTQRIESLEESHDSARRALTQTESELTDLQHFHKERVTEYETESARLCERLTTSEAERCSNIELFFI